MAALTTQTITRTGITPAYGAVAASDTFTPGDDVFLHVKNGGASSDTVAVQVLAGDPVGLTITDVSIAVPNGEERIIGPFPAYFFASPSTGVGTITHTYTTTVTIAVLSVQRP